MLQSLHWEILKQLGYIFHQMLHIKKAIVKNERNDRFAKVHSQEESNVPEKKKINIARERKRSRAGQMRQRQ